MVVLDFDGTLAPIAPRPEEARLGADTREVLRTLSRRLPVAIVSGRAIADVRALVGIEELLYAGSHGLVMSGPGFEEVEEVALSAAASLEAVDRELRAAIGGVEGVVLEPKPHAYAVHYRHTPAVQLGEVFGQVEAIVAAHPDLRMRHGKKVIDVLPVGGHKGLAVSRLRRRYPGAYLLYLGDDTTDEDGFAAVADHGLGILVARQPLDSHASAWLRDPDEVRRLLERLAAVGSG
jgi:trehalose-phosphatase